MEGAKPNGSEWQKRIAELKRQSEDIRGRIDLLMRRKESIEMEIERLKATSLINRINSYSI